MREVGEHRAKVIDNYKQLHAKHSYRLRSFRDDPLARLRRGGSLELRCSSARPCSTRTSSRTCNRWARPANLHNFGNAAFKGNAAVSVDLKSSTITSARSGNFVDNCQLSTQMQNQDPQFRQHTQGQAAQNQGHPP